MFWKKGSEWAKLAPSSPSAIRFGVAASKGFEKLVIVPNDPVSQQFIKDVDTLANEACVPEISQAQFGEIVDELESIITKFSRRQRSAIEDSISEVYDGLRDVLKSLEGAIATGHTLEDATQSASTRLLSLQSAKSYEEVIGGIKKEIATLNSAVEKHREDAKLVRKVASQHVEVLRTKLKHAEKAVRTDHLTKLGNRSAFDFLLTVGIAKIAHGERYCLAIMDVDKFKHINDSRGHLCGDAALVAIANRLTETFSLPGTSVVRYGGDEFAVLYRGSLVQLEAKLERVNTILAKNPLVYEGASIPLHISYGAIELTPEHTPDVAVAEADQVMYVAKRRAA